MKVVTTSGKLVRDVPPGQTVRKFTEEEATAFANECNTRAEKLGIKTRYEVKP